MKISKIKYFPGIRKRAGTFLAIIVLAGWAAALSAQEQMIKLPGGGMSVERLIGEIESQSGLIVGVNHRTFDIDREIYLPTGQLPARELLNRITAGTGHTYIVRGNHAIVVQEDKPAGGKSEVETTTEATIRPDHIGIRTEEKNMPPAALVNEYTTIAFRTAEPLVFAVRTPGENNGMRIEDTAIVQENEQVAVSFTATAGEETVNTNQALTIRPVLNSGEMRYELPPLFLEGRKHALSVQRRNKSSRVDRPVRSDVIPMENGGTVYYHQVFPDSVFVPGASLVFEIDAADCRRFYSETAREAARDFVTLHREVIEQPLPPPSTGDRIARDYPFVEEDPGTNLLHIRPDRRKAMTIYYDLDRYDIRYEYRNNRLILAQMIAAINVIRDSGDSEITHVVLTGYASPEGPQARNEMLAGNRSRALRDFIVSRTGLPERAFVMHNGGSDWEGLEILVEDADITRKAEVLDILRHSPESDRMRRIRALDGGKVYEQILDGILPELRNAAYIKVYYKNK